MESSIKKELLNHLIERMNMMTYEENEISLHEFLSEGEVILGKLFGERSKHVNKFNEVSFISMASIFNRDSIQNLYSDKFNAFESGRLSMINVLKGALKEIEIEELLSPTSKSTLESTLKVSTDKSKVFIVHGHDNELKIEVARFVEKLGFEAVILHEKANEGNTIIEKIEKNSDVGFAIVLYTPCDEGKSKSSEHLNSRARQNVVFEHGFFIAKLGRKNVVALHKGKGIELPNDISGVVYIKYEDGAWKTQIADEMDASGYEINYKLVR